MKQASILIGFLLLLAVNTTGQNNLKKHFEKDLISYTTAFNNKQWNTVTTMMYPRIFDLMSKENLVMIFEQMDQIGIKMNTDFKSIDKISPVVENGKEKYCKINYSGLIKVKLTGLMAQGSSIIQPQFEKEFGKDNVKYDETTNSFTINAKRSMVAVANKNSTTWKYVDVNSTQAKGLKNLIPLTVRKQLN
jgi:hypothetical protein